MALDRYQSFSAEEKKIFRLHPGVTIEELEGKRDKLLPYSAAEVGFVFSALEERIRNVPELPDSSYPPTGLVADLSIKIKKRVPLLTRLMTRGRVVRQEGKRIFVEAQIFGKKTTRISAADPDMDGEWNDGKWDVVFAEAKGSLVVLYGTDLAMKPKI
jgi:hypothetical protein